MPTGLGITQPYNIYEHNQTTFNGISNITLESENTDKKKELISLQSGGRHYDPNSCEITFYIFDYPIKFGEEENNDLTEDEELSEDIDLRKAELADEGDDEDDEGEDDDEDDEDEAEEREQSKIIGETTSNSSKSKMKRKLSDLIDDIVSNSEEEEEEVEQSEEGGGRKGRVKINNLGPLFSNQSNNTNNTNYDSHDTLHSILRALNEHKSKKTTRGSK